MNWLYTLEKDYTVDLKKYFSEAELNGWEEEVPETINFYSINQPRIQILELHNDHKMVVKAGYAWDGNSPKFPILDLFWFGTPDGLIFENYPKAYYSSMVHDCISQLKRRKRMPSLFAVRGYDCWFAKGRRNRDGLFYKMMRSNRFFLAETYWLNVFLFGPLYDGINKYIKKVNQLRKNRPFIPRWLKRTIVLALQIVMFPFILFLTGKAAVFLFCQFLEFICFIRDKIPFI